jgi:nucleoside-diphosphate-sugar epimerase
MATALVTGATGLVGSHLVERLLERGRQVRALVRPQSRIDFLQERGAEIVPGDLADPASLIRALAGVEIVYHCAARPPLGGTARQFFRDNVAGTENLLQAARYAGAARFIHVSTVDVYGYGHHDGTNEQAPLRADGLYSWSKIEAERVVMQCYEQHGLPVSILRPCLIYGPRDRNLLPTVIRLISHKHAPLICGGRVLLDLVYAGDVAEALYEASVNPEAVGQVYNITDGARRTLLEVIQILSRSMGCTPRYLRVPYSLAYGAAWVVSGLSSWLKFSTLPVLRWEVIKAMGHHRHFNIAKAREELGYRPQVPLETGLQLTLQWYRAQRPHVVQQK